MAEAYEVKAGFPLNGLSEVTPYSDQEIGTSADMLNVVPFDAKGRLRGSRRPGLDKFSTALVSGANKVQCISTVSATKVDPVLGTADVFVKGNLANATGYSLLAAADGADTDLHTTFIALGAVFGPDNFVYVVRAATNNVNLYKYSTAGALQAGFPVTMFVDSATPAEAKLLGLAIDEDTLFVWYGEIDNIGEGIMRFDFTGVNRDSTTKGVFVRAEADVTHIERAFGGVTNGGYTTGTPDIGWHVIPATSQSGMKLYQGKLAIIGAPLLDAGTDTEHELVLYVMDLKTGIIDAVHDLGVDGTDTSANKAVFLDLEFGLDGFIYVLFKDDDTTGSTDIYLIRKIDSAGNGIWEIKMTEAEGAAPTSICWNPDRAMLVVVGDTLFGDADISLAVIEPDSKGIVDYVDLGSLSTWTCVRCDSDGNYYVWSSASTTVHAYAPAFGAATWTNTLTGAASQSKVCVNQFWNSGADEQGSSRYQETLAVSNGVLSKMTASTSTTVDGSLTLSTTATTIHSANFGVLVFFADGETARYYDPSEGANGTILDWTAANTYGILPKDSNGGFPYIEAWNRRLIIFGLEEDTSNWYMCAKNNPFDWKQQSNVTGAAISGRTSPAGLFPKGDRIYGVIPYNDDLVIFAGDRSMYQLSLDPAVDAQFDLITDTVGIAPGRAWCKDGFGSVYFFGNNGGIYKMSLNSPPQRISNKSIDKRFENVDLPNTTVRLLWDSLMQGIHVFLTPVTTPVVTEQYFFDFRTEGWFPYKFADVSYQPYSVGVSELDEPQDQKILIGGSDGFIRKFNNALNTDDSSIFAGHFTLGPWIPREGSNTQLMLKRMDVVVGAGSSLKCEVLSGIDAEDVVTDGRSIYSTELSEKRSNVHHPRAAGKALMVKVKSEDAVARGMNFEEFRGQMSDVRNL
tara:strand:- start:2924 stop:5653 length:2730 start_codon:yes stop_codon:yes gene_type:complete